jgi:hypothetical protein
MMRNLSLTTIAAALVLATTAHAEPRRETAILAGGCFWGMENVMQTAPGILSIERIEPATTSAISTSELRCSPCLSR